MGKDKAKIGDYAARIRRATARLERMVILKGSRAAETGTMSGAPYRWAIQDAGEGVMAAVRRAQRKLGAGWTGHAVIAQAVRAANAEFTRARPLFLDPE
jgi:hypothetical protein